MNNDIDADENPSEFLEIIELDSGEVALFRTGEDGPEGDPLALVRFSAETRDFLAQLAPHAEYELARTMFEAAMAQVNAWQEDADDLRPLGQNAMLLH